MSAPAGEPGRTRIFLLDDHEIVRHGLRDLFESEDDLVVVGESGSAKEAERNIVVKLLKDVPRYGRAGMA